MPPKEAVKDKRKHSQYPVVLVKIRIIRPTQITKRAKQIL